MQAEIVTAAKKQPTGDLLILADLYGVSTDYILGRTNNKNPK